MKVLKNIINTKLLIIGIVIGGIVGCIGVGAATYSNSDDAYYDNSNTDLSATTVQEALDELYLKVNPPDTTTVEGTIYYQMMSNASLDNTSSTYVTSSTGIDFSAISSNTNGKGVYELSSTANDEYPIYYYRGAVTDNNVIFAGFCWKIVRTTETGGVKLIYNGTPSSGQCNNTGTSSQLSSTSAFNSSYSYNAYVGYMYGAGGSSSYAAEHANTNNSAIKNAIDNWYKSNMTSYTEKLEDTVWCNDRSMSSGKGYGTSTGIYGASITYYGAYNRLAKNKTPSLACTNVNDRFTTVSSSNGNGDLTYPVALLTADEIAYAGAVFDTSNSTYYLYTGSYWWSLSPFDFALYLADEPGSAYVLYVTSGGDLYYYDYNNPYNNYGVNKSYGVRPTVSLKPGTIYTSGDGSTSSPYIVS
jgi:hypothetical protein